MAADMGHLVRADQRIVAFDPETPPAITVRPGELVTFETVDTEAERVQSERDIVSLEGIDFSAGDISGGNPAAGPVFVRGAELGDVLAVDVMSIELAPRGWACAFPGIGPLRELIEHEQTWFFDVRGDYAVRGDLRVPLNPMIGVIGVAPSAGRIGTDFPGRHGGNLDNRFIAAGSTVYLPVRQPGALLALGDLHAAMGDGELTGSGLEIGGRVATRIRLIKNTRLEWPVVETEDTWYVHGSSGIWQEAVEHACLEAARILIAEWSIPSGDVPLYLTLAGDLGVCQSCQPSPFAMVARLGVRKSPSVPRLFSRAQ